MRFFNRKKTEVITPEIQAHNEALQNENDDLLDQIEALKLDVSELKSENQHLTERLSRSKYQQKLTKTGGGLVVLFISYMLLSLLGEPSRYMIWLLLIEAVFIFMMLRGDEK